MLKIIRLTWNDRVSLLPQKTLECIFESSAEVFIEASVENGIESTVEIGDIDGCVLDLENVTLHLETTKTIRYKLPSQRRRQRLI